MRGAGIGGKPIKYRAILSNVEPVGSGQNDRD